MAKFRLEIEMSWHDEDIQELVVDIQEVLRLDFDDEVKVTLLPMETEATWRWADEGPGPE